MAFTWLLAILVSFFLRLWGLQHPGEFVVRPWLVWFLLFTPSLMLGGWLFFAGFQDNKD